MNTPNTTPLKLTALLAATLLTIPCLSAQDAVTNEPTTPNAPSCPRPWHHDKGPFKDLLTPAEHKELADARKSAFSQDPSLEQNLKAAAEAMKTAHDAVKAAMIKADPNVATILQKLEAARPHHPEGEPAPGANQPAPATETGSN